MMEQYVRRVEDGPNTNPALQIEVAGISDVGCRRSNNEDCFGYDLQAKIFVVCDGMGGMAGGEVASSIAVERTIQVYSEQWGLSISAEERLDTAIAAANTAVWSAAQEHRKLNGMGTTLVAACILQNRIAIGNVGDSRAYFLRDDGCVQITEDHSYRAEQMRHRSAPEDWTGLATRQYITRAVGAEREVKPDLFVAELRSGDTILLATDGLTRYIDAKRIGSEIQLEDSAQETCRSLIAMAYERGAEDNVTCLLIRIR